MRSAFGHRLPLVTVHPDGFFPLPGQDGPCAYRLGPPGRGALPLVLLPGIEGDGRVFVEQIPLSNARVVHANDLPAEGGTLHVLGEQILRAVPFERFVVSSDLPSKKCSK